MRASGVASFTMRASASARAAPVAGTDSHRSATTRHDGGGAAGGSHAAGAGDVVGADDGGAPAGSPNTRFIVIGKRVPGRPGFVSARRYVRRTSPQPGSTNHRSRRLVTPT